MAKKETKKYKIRGIAAYPRLNEPDTKYNKFGNYKADLRLPVKDAMPIIKQIQEVAKAHIGKPLPLKKNPCWRYEIRTDEDTGEETETGFVLFKLQVKNREVTDKRTKEKTLWDRKPKVFSASGKYVPKVKVGAGTEYTVTFEIYEGKDGDGNHIINLQPVAVQIWKLVEYTGGGGNVDASDYGIEAGDGWEPEDDFGDEDEGQDEGSGSEDDGSGEEPADENDDF